MEGQTRNKHTWQVGYNIGTFSINVYVQCRNVHQGGSNLFLSSQTDKLMAATKFSDYLGLKHFKKAKKLKHFIHLALAYWPQSFVIHTVVYNLQGIQATNYILRKRWSNIGQHKHMYICTIEVVLRLIACGILNCTSSMPQFVSPLHYLLDGSSTQFSSRRVCCSHAPIFVVQGLCLLLCAWVMRD